MKNATKRELNAAAECSLTDAEVRMLKRVKAKLDRMRQLEMDNTMRQFDDLSENDLQWSRLRLSALGEAQHHIDETIGWLF